MITSTEDYASTTFLSPVVQVWIDRIKQAREAKKEFRYLAEACNSFYAGKAGFMWEQSFRSKYLGKMRPPQFRITLSKAFEFVAIYGPNLFWRIPHRRVEVTDAFPLDPELFGLTPEAQQQIQQFQQMMQDPQQMQQLQQDPQQMMQMQQLMQREQMFNQAVSSQNSHTKMLGHGAEMMGRYLDYSQREQPGGGLRDHGQLSVIEALVKGRGVLWPQTYSFPGSDRVLTGLFHGSVDDLLIDPDCVDPNLVNCRYIIRRHVDPVWHVERMFKLPRGSLAAHANLESSDSLADKRDDLNRQRRDSGLTNDLLLWYEIWSKDGVTARDPQTDEGKRINLDLLDAFDDTVGDFAYLAIANDVPYPLNAPSDQVSTASDDEVKEMFTWRASRSQSQFPAYLDGRWPVALLDFYPNPNSCWPIPPLAPGLGELITLNVLTTAYVEQAYSNRKLIIAALKSAQQDVEGALGTDANPAYVEINDAAQRSVQDMIQYLQRPQMNQDIIGAIQYVTTLFDKRVGLSDIQYAVQAGAVDRSARATAAKQEAASVRPDMMAAATANWMSHGGQLEMFLAAWNVQGEDLQPLLGPIGAQLWNQLIVNADPEQMIREWRIIVDAIDLRKPNREREFGNLSSMLGYMLPVLQQYAQVTTDSEPLNAFFGQIAESMEQDLTGMQLKAFAPPPPPPPDPMQQQMTQLQMGLMQADIQDKQMDAAETQVDIQAKQLEMQQAASGQSPEVMKQQMDLQFDAAKKQQDMQFDQMKMGQKMQADQAKMGQDMQFDQARKAGELEYENMRRQMELQNRMQDAGLGMQIKRAEGKQSLRQDRESFVQDLGQDSASHQQEMGQDQDSFEQEMIQNALAGRQKLSEAQAMSRVKVKQAGNGKK